MRDYSDDEIHLSDDEELEEEPVIDPEVIRQQEIEAKKEEERQEKRALYKQEADHIRDELEELIKVSD